MAVDLTKVEKDLELANQIAAQINPLAGLVMTGIRATIALLQKQGVPTQEYEVALAEFEAARGNLRSALDDYDRIRASIVANEAATPSK